MSEQRTVTCDICPHRCKLSSGAVGFCRGRQNLRGKIVPLNYGHITSMALDPIEKKPLARFYPGHYILSVGGFGCNLRCPFCQNHDISQVGNQNIRVRDITSAELVDVAVNLTQREPGNLGLAFTYNEPLINYEFILDTAKLLRQHGLKIVLVTNGMINEQSFKRLLPYIDAMNIDLKGFSDKFYNWLGGDLTTVRRTIELAVANCHVEVTTLVIPAENDDERDIAAMGAWLASLSPDIPWHLSRYFPRYQMTKPATEVARIYFLADIARRHLRYVYTGNC